MISPFHRSLPTCLLLGLLCCRAATAEERVEGTEPEPTNGATVIRVGRLEAGFSPTRGVFVCLDTIPIIERSDFLVRNETWKQVVARLGRGKVTVAKNGWGGPPEITVRSADTENGDFRFWYRLTIEKETEVEVRFAYKWKGKEPVRLEYCAGLLATNPTKGAAYIAALGDQDRPGNLPLGVPSLRWLTAPFEFSFDRLALESRLGVLSLEVTADQPLKFRRESDDTDEYHAGSMGFWAGWPNAAVAPDSAGAVTYRLRLPRSSTRKWISPHPGGRDTGGEPVAVPDALAPALKNLVLIPAPQQMEPLEQDFVLNEDTRLLVPASATAAELRATDEIRACLRERFGLSLRVVDSLGAGGATNCLVVGQPLWSPEAAALCRREGVQVTPYDPGPEGYELVVRPDYVLLVGADTAGCYYGAQTLKQLIDVRPDERLVLRGARVRDWPDFGFRGVHLLADDYALEWQTQLISNVLAPLKTNNLILECEYGKWDSHPELAQPWGMSKDDMRQLKAVAEKHFMRVTPLIQSLGHCEWMFAGGQHADLVEDPRRPYAYCPSNPKSHQLLFDIYAEALEVFQPEYFHIGHDEVANRGEFGTCPRCKGTPPATLFAGNVRDLHRFLQARGVKTMMWGDMLLRPGEAEDAAHGGDPYLTGDARAAIPKDVVICDWHYSPYRDYPSARTFANAGFDVVGCTWHNRKNIFYFSQAAKRYDAVGLLQTTWTGHNGNRQALRRHPEQLYAYVTAAEFAWTAATPALEDLPYRRSEVFRDCLFPQPAVLGRTPGFLVPLADVCNVNFADNRVPGDWLGYGLTHDLRRLPTGRQRLQSVLFDLLSPLDNGRRGAVLLSGAYTRPDAFPDEVTLPVGRPAARLAFVHTTAWPVPKLTVVGSYEVQYVDGSSATVPLTYGENIHAWDDETATDTESLLWTGTTVGGVPVSVGSATWQNPAPDKAIDKLVFRSAGTEASPVLLAVTGVASAASPLRTARR